MKREVMRQHVAGYSHKSITHRARPRVSPVGPGQVSPLLGTVLGTCSPLCLQCLAKWLAYKADTRHLIERMRVSWRQCQRLLRKQELLALGRKGGRCEHKKVIVRETLVYTNTWLQRLEF